jgi:hypothetical protein
MATTKKTNKRAMTDEHKAALAQGRNEGRAVRRYLEALDAHRPKRGRKRTPESIQRRLDAIDADIAEADPLKRVQLIQERMDLEAELASNQAGEDIGDLEAEFVKAAKGYAERKGISYGAWREFGVPAAILKQAGISRSRG